MLKEKIAQMLLMGFSGLSLEKNTPIYHWIAEVGIGGVILFDSPLNEPDVPKNCFSRAQITSLTQDLKRLNDSRSTSLPLIVSIDYEGGEVDRLKNLPDFPKTRTAFELAHLEEQDLDKACQEMASTLHSLGINLNFAPVVDLSLMNEAGIIGRKKRSFSADPKEVVRVAHRFIEVFRAHGVQCCLKHFPGHGSATGDTHLDCVDVSHTFQPTECLPFESLINHYGSEVMVMTAHVINRQLDPSGLPATLSYPILTGLLREKYGFEGVVVSDDLQMKALSDHFSLEDNLVQTIEAGADMLIFGNQWGSHDAALLVDSIFSLVNQGKIKQERIEESYERIKHFKTSLSRI